MADTTVTLSSGSDRLEHFTAAENLFLFEKYNARKRLLFSSFNQLPQVVQQAEQ